jgi:hypothetical protein
MRTSIELLAVALSLLNVSRGPCWPHNSFVYGRYFDLTSMVQFENELGLMFCANVSLRRVDRDCKIA